MYLLGKNNVTLKPTNTTLTVNVVNYEDGFLFLNIIKKVKPFTTDTGSMEWPYFFLKSVTFHIQWETVELFLKLKHIYKIVYAFLENYFTANCQHKSGKIENYAHLIFRTLSLLNKNNVYIIYYNCNFLYQVWWKHEQFHIDTNCHGFLRMRPLFPLRFMVKYLSQ